MKNIKFIIIAFVAVILLPSISFGSIYYFKKHNVAPQPIIQTPEVKPDIVTETPKTEETKTEPVKETPTPTPVKTPVKETPKVETPVEPVKVVCDSNKISLYESEFKVGYNAARTEMLSKITPDSTEADNQQAMNDNELKVQYLYSKYVQEMRDANCELKSLVGGLIPN